MPRFVAATGTRDDGNGEVMVLIPVGDDIGVDSVAPNSSANMKQVFNLVRDGSIPPVSASLAGVNDGHAYYLSWMARRRLTPDV
jgi:hypothetical protein